MAELSRARRDPNQTRRESAALAGRQHGTIAQRQLIRVGFTRSSIYRAVRAGRLHPVLPAVYAVGHTALTWHGRVMAAVLWGGEGTVASHLTAAVLWDLLRGSRIDVTVPRNSRASRRGVHVHQVRHLDPRDVTVRDGIPVTSLARTLLDLAETESPARLERALEQAERMKRLDVRALDAVRRRNPGRRGLSALTAALKDFDPQAAETNVGLERELLKLIREYELPQPRINVSVGPYVVDFLWEEQKLIVEADSYEHHRGRAIFESDRKRDIALRLAGYTVIRLTHRRLREEPAAVAEELQAFLSASSPGCSSQG